MNKLFMPEFYVKSIYSINFQRLSDLGIKNLIIDIDNTLMPWGSKDADDNVIKLICNLVESKFKICFLSNSSNKRVKRFIGEMDVECFSLGRKPMRTMFKGAMKKLDGDSENTCVIGDQIFTDILGGNRCHLHTILVDPLSEGEFITSRINRRLEKRIREKLKYAKELMNIE